MGPLAAAAASRGREVCCVVICVLFWEQTIGSKRLGVWWGKQEKTWQFGNAWFGEVVISR